MKFLDYDQKTQESVGGRAALLFGRIVLEPEPGKDAAYRWIGRPIRANKKLIPKKRKGCDNSETTVGKLLARRIQTYSDYFCKPLFWPIIFETRENRVPTKIV